MYAVVFSQDAAKPNVRITKQVKQKLRLLSLFSTYVFCDAMRWPSKYISMKEERILLKGSFLKINQNRMWEKQ